jgi:hypothetical protein
MRKSYQLYWYAVPLIIFIIHASTCHAQVIITGKITDQKNNPIGYANISILGTYEGTVTDDSGRFELHTNQKEKFKLGASAINLETTFKDIDPAAGNQHIEFKLKEAYASLSPAVITAGTFAAGEHGKAELFRPRDMGTTAGTPGDIQATIETLPGTQRIGYSEGLFVRGGSDKESKYIMDGMIYPHPYYSHVPSLKQHGRLDPFLFAGTIFSAGGYSAQYGQALSSVLILNSRGIADSTISGGGIHSYGGNIFHTHRWKNASLYVNGYYNNLAVYHEMMHENTDWTKSPVNMGLRLVLRANAGKNALLKVFTDVSNTTMGINFHQPDTGDSSGFRITNGNMVINASYTKYFDDNRSSLFAAVAASYDSDRIHDADISMQKSDFLGEGKIIYKHSVSKNLTWLAGGEFTGTRLSGSIGSMQSDVTDPMVSLFTESEATIMQKFAIRLGVRSEYSAYSRGTDIAPRSSLAWKFSAKSQLSFSYGVFYQMPEPLVMLYNPAGLSQEKSSHYIANYQFQFADRTFRAEVYYKQYADLVTEYVPQRNYPGTAGYARGFEIFYRDRKTIPGLDTWISYSFTDSRRRTIIPDSNITPGFVSKHTLSVVGKYWFGKARMFISASCHFATARNFAFSPDSIDYFLLPVPALSSLDMSISKPVKLLGRPSMLFFSVQNLWGTNKLLGYEKVPAFAEPIQIYRSEKRSIFFGIFISMYND